MSISTEYLLNTHLYWRNDRPEYKRHTLKYVVAFEQHEIRECIDLQWLAVVTGTFLCFLQVGRPWVSLKHRLVPAFVLPLGSPTNLSNAQCTVSSLYNYTIYFYFFLEDRAHARPFSNNSNSKLTQSNNDSLT